MSKKIKEKIVNYRRG